MVLLTTLARLSSSDILYGGIGYGIVLALVCFCTESGFFGTYQAVEFTTELLISPIEVSTQTYSPSQVQEFYYSKVVSGTRFQLSGSNFKKSGPRYQKSH